MTGSTGTEGTLAVTLHPGSSRRHLEVRQDGLHLYTTKKAVENRANRDAIDILAEALHMPRRDISLVRGNRSRHKVFLLENLSDQRLHRMADEVAAHIRRSG